MTVFGTQTPQTEDDTYNTFVFMVRQMLAKVNTCCVVKVVGCTNSGGAVPVGMVDVVPLVNQMTGDRTAVPHGTIYSLPYTRLQGGTNAIIIDPQVGDIGIVVFSQRDISSVVATKAQANPGSFRMFNWSDGIYIGGILNGTPVQFVEFTDRGIQITSPGEVTIKAPAIVLDGDVSVTGTTTGTGDGTFAGVDVATHVHSGVSSGGSDTGPPV